MVPIEEYTEKVIDSLWSVMNIVLLNSVESTGDAPAKDPELMLITRAMASPAKESFFTRKPSTRALPYR